MFLGTGRPPLASCSWSYGREFPRISDHGLRDRFPRSGNSGWDFSRVPESWLVRRRRGCVPGCTGRLFLHCADARTPLQSGCFGPSAGEALSLLEGLLSGPSELSGSPGVWMLGFRSFRIGRSFPFEVGTSISFLSPTDFAVDFIFKVFFPTPKLYNQLHF